MYAWRGGRNKHVHGHVSSSKQLKSWIEASSFQAGKPASETNNAGISLPLRQRELEKHKEQNNDAECYFVSWMQNCLAVPRVLWQ